VSQLRRLFEVVLPLHTYTIEESLAVVAWTNGVITKHIAHIVSAERRRAKKVAL
jgi:hypothetical protein